MEESGCVRLDWSRGISGAGSETRRDLRIPVSIHDGLQKPRILVHHGSGKDSTPIDSLQKLLDTYNESRYAPTTSTSLLFRRVERMNSSARLAFPTPGGPAISRHCPFLNPPPTRVLSVVDSVLITRRFERSVEADWLVGKSVFACVRGRVVALCSTLSASCCEMLNSERLE